MSSAAEKRKALRTQFEEVGNKVKSLCSAIEQNQITKRDSSSQIRELESILPKYAELFHGAWMYGYITGYPRLETLHALIADFKSSNVLTAPVPTTTSTEVGLNEIGLKSTGFNVPYAQSISDENKQSIATLQQLQQPQIQHKDYNDIVNKITEITTMFKPSCSASYNTPLEKLNFIYTVLASYVNAYNDKEQEVTDLKTQLDCLTSDYNEREAELEAVVASRAQDANIHRELTEANIEINKLNRELAAAKAVSTSNTPKQDIDKYLHNFEDVVNVKAKQLRYLNIKTRDGQKHTFRLTYPPSIQSIAEDIVKLINFGKYIYNLDMSQSDKDKLRMIFGNIQYMLIESVTDIIDFLNLYADVFKLIPSEFIFQYDHTAKNTAKNNINNTVRNRVAQYDLINTTFTTPARTKPQVELPDLINTTFTTPSRTKPQVELPDLISTSSTMTSTLASAPIAISPINNSSSVPDSIHKLYD